MSIHHCLQAIHDVVTDFGRIGHERFFYDFNRSDRGFAGNRIAADRASVTAGRPRHDLTFCNHCADGHARCDAFCNRNDVRLNTVMFGSEPFAGTSHTALYFVGHVKDAVLFANLFQPLVVIGRWRDVTTFALNRFDKNGGNIIGRDHFCKILIFQHVYAIQIAGRISEVVRTAITITVRNMGNARQKRREMLALLHFAGG